MYTSWGEAAAAGRVVVLLLLISGGAFRIGAGYFLCHFTFDTSNRY